MEPRFMKLPLDADGFPQEEQRDTCDVDEDMRKHGCIKVLRPHHHDAEQDAQSGRHHHGIQHPVGEMGDSKQDRGPDDAGSRTGER